MTLKLIKYHPLFAYSVGDVFEVNDSDTNKLLEGKYAVPVDGADIETASDKEAAQALNDAKVYNTTQSKKNKHNK
jgi:hypothetical protein